MSSPFSPGALAILAVGALAPAAFCQDVTPTPAAPTPPAAPAAAAIDPAAKALLDQMATAYTGLNAYSCTIESAQGAQKISTTLRFQRPTSAFIRTVAGGHLVAQVDSNGTSLFQLATDGKSYQKAAVPPGNAIPAVLSQGGSETAVIIANTKALVGILEGPAAKSIAMGAPQTINGTTTDTVVVTLTSPNGGGEQVTFALDPTSHLIAQLSDEQLPAADGGTPPPAHVETVTTSNASPTFSAADFVFVPPTGAKKVDSIQPPMYDPRIKVGAKPFPVKATDLKGTPISLATYHGKVVMLDFWATWCGPCVGEMPNVIAAYKKYHAKGFDIVGVSLDRPGAKAVLTAFLKKNGMTWPQIYDGGYWSAKVARQYGVMAIPFSIIIGKNGKIAAVDARGPALEPAVKAALAH
jgi:thiol-disulfide isomerase/thioredoxin